MKIASIGTLLLCALYATSSGQTAADKQAAVAVVERVFKAMEAGDSAALHACFTADVSLVSIGERKDGTERFVRESSIMDFLVAVGTSHKDVWYEVGYDFKTEIDGSLAQVWCSYAFFLGNQFSHCGADAFQLVKQNGVWKIFHLADTQRRDACAVPPAIQSKHKQ